MTPGDGVVHVELTDPPRPLALGAAPVGRVLVTHRGVPVAWPEVANPGRGGEAALRDLLIGPVRREMLRRAEVEDSLVRRLGVGGDTVAEPLAVSMVVCTHRRPDALRRLLDALERLDPAPHEVIVVDNDPGTEPCRDAVLAAGFRYVREDGRGLDRARSAGLRVARGDVVAYTDDDCVPPPGWLARLARHFADPSVAAVTGPAFAWTLATPAQARFEREDGFQRGFRERIHTWATLPPTRASVVGAGANMSFRRAVLADLADPFPATLDAGTPTQSGGDMCAFAELLERGHRIVYDPGVWVWHEHRREPAALHRALWGYGVGYASALLRIAAERDRLAAGRAWTWLLGQYVLGTAARAVGRGDAVRQRLGWDYLRGGLAAPARYRHAVREAQAAAPKATAATAAASSSAEVEAAAPASSAAAASAAPAVSVVVPTFERPQALDRLLASLARQDGAPAFEIIVVDDALLESPAREPSAYGLPVRTVAGGRGGAARARNRGASVARAPLLLFLDDDLVADPGLVRAHVEQHAGRPPGIAVGRCSPRPPRRTMAADLVAWWWWDELAQRRRLAVPGFKEVLSGNTSMPAVLFRNLGGFSDRFAHLRREDWELGLRATTAGVPIRLAEAAMATHEFELDTARLVRAAHAEGRGDALLLAGHPDAAAALPLGSASGLFPRYPVRALVVALLGRAWLRARAVSVLDRLERHRWRRAWLSLAALTQHAAYRAGARAGGVRRTPRSRGALAVDLDATAPLVPPAALGRVELRAPGQRPASVHLPEARWSRALAAELAGRAPWSLLAAANGSAAAPAPDRIATPARDAARNGAHDAVPVLSLDAGLHAVDAAIRSSRHDRVVVALPGVRVTAAWTAAAAAPLNGERVGLVLGAGLPPGSLPHALDLYERRMLARRLPARGAPPRAAAIDRSAYLAAGGFDHALERFHPLVPLLDLAQRLLDDGWVLGAFAAPGLTPDGSRRRDRVAAEWARHRALGALARRRAGRFRMFLSVALDGVGLARPGGRRHRALRLAAEAYELLA